MAPVLSTVYVLPPLVCEAVAAKAACVPAVMAVVTFVVDLNP
jgi:hypothetical protein